MYHKLNFSKNKLLFFLILLLIFLSCNSLSFASNAVVTTSTRYTVDFDYVQQFAPNAVAWIYQEGTDINTPIVYSSDSRFYLQHTHNDKRNQTGAIFVTGDVAPNFSTDQIVLYGQNNYDNSLFGSLSLYKDLNYYNEHPSFLLVTPDGEYQLDIFAGIRTDYYTSNVTDVPHTNLSLWLDLLLENSFISPPTESLPTSSDEIVVLANASTGTKNSRYVLYARKRPIQYSTNKVSYLYQFELDEKLSQNRKVYTDTGKHWQYYSQTDPIWNRLMFEVQHTSKKRIFGHGGCGPTAIAIALVNILEPEELPKIEKIAASPSGFSFCSCSVNEYWCIKHHIPYTIKTVEAYQRYLPLVIANIATGNNVWEIFGRLGTDDSYGTNMNYLPNICEAYDITFTQVEHILEHLTFFDNPNSIAIACTNTKSSPFTSSSHFVVIAGVDENYMYIMDPLRRTDYSKTDEENLLEIITPGLVRVALEDVGDCHLYPTYLLQK